MRILKFFPLTMFFFGVLHSYAQDPIIRTFTTQKYMMEMAVSDEFRYDQEKQIEKQIKEFTRHGVLNEYTLPIVFHIVQISEMPSIGDHQIATQMEALNRDFGRTQIQLSHPNDPDDLYKGRAENPLIQFCSPTNDEQGKATTGVIKKTLSIESWETFNAVKNISPAWNTANYINVWVTALKDENAGYAQMPGTDPSFDGIVIDYKYFGQGGTAQYPYDEGKTLTHLIGSYLGLYPLWGESECSDDYVDDTPIHNSINFTCPKFDHVSTCDGYPTEMTMNFMDATYDACRYMFTNGQIKRMQAVLSEKGFRSLLGETETNCDQKERIVNQVTNEQPINYISEETTTIQIIPNPAKEKVYLNFDGITTKDYIQLSVMDSGGKLIKNANLNQDQIQHELDISLWTPGVYFLNFKFDGQIVTERLIVQ